MKITTLGIVSLFLLTSCATSKRMYLFKMNEPSISDQLQYADELIDISFEIRQNDISFRCKNNSTSLQKIVWDESSFVRNEEAQKVIHKNVKFIDKEKSQALTTIPPKTYISEVIQPIDDIRFETTSFGRNSYSKWSTSPLFSPEFKNANYPFQKIGNKYEKLIGQVVKFYLPIAHDNIRTDYYFEFELVDVVLTKKGKPYKSLVFKDKKY